MRIEPDFRLGKRRDRSHIEGKDQSETVLPGIIHAAFRNQYISVSSACASLLLDVARDFEAMVALEPTGTLVGAFHIERADNGVLIRDDASTAPEHWYDLHSGMRALRDALIKRFIQMRRDLVWLHAGVVSFAGRALLFAAPPGHGKSTLVSELLDWGCDYLSDEVAPIDPINGTVLPFPVSPWKRVPTNNHVPLDRLDELPKRSIRLAPASVSLNAVSLGQIYFVQLKPDLVRTSIAPCSAAVAALEMSRNSVHLHYSRDVESRRLREIVARLEAAQLIYADAREAASHVIQAARLT